MNMPDIPYQFHHSVGNECFIGFWGYPFVFDGCFINWSEWNELPILDLDVIFVVIEKRIDECKIEYLRKKYPNSIIIGLGIMDDIYYFYVYMKCTLNPVKIQVVEFSFQIFL